MLRKGLAEYGAFALLGLVLVGAGVLTLTGNAGFESGGITGFQTASAIQCGNGFIDSMGKFEFGWFTETSENRALDIDISDPEGLQSVTYYFQGSQGTSLTFSLPITPGETSYTTNFDVFNNAPEGISIISITVVDGTGVSCTLEEWIYKKDNPQVTITHTQPTGVIEGGGDVEFEFNIEMTSWIGIGVVTMHARTPGGAYETYDLTASEMSTVGANPATQRGVFKVTIPNTKITRSDLEYYIIINYHNYYYPINYETAPLVLSVPDDKVYVVNSKEVYASSGGFPDVGTLKELSVTNPGKIKLSVFYDYLYVGSTNLRLGVVNTYANDRLVDDFYFVSPIAQSEIGYDFSKGIKHTIRIPDIFSAPEVKLKFNYKNGDNRLAIANLKILAEIVEIVAPTIPDSETPLNIADLSSVENPDGVIGEGDTVYFYSDNGSGYPILLGQYDSTYTDSTPVTPAGFLVIHVPSGTTLAEGRLVLTYDNGKTITVYIPEIGESDMFVAVDGSTYSNVEWDSGSSFVGPARLINVVRAAPLPEPPAGLNPPELVYWGPGYKAFAVETSDITPPVITHTPETSGIAGGEVIIRSEVSDNMDTNPLVYISVITATGFKTSWGMAKRDGEYSTYLGGSYMAEPSLQYRIASRDSSGNMAYLPGPGPDDYYTIIVSSPTGAFISGAQVADTTPPRIAHTAVTRVVEGQTIRFEATVTDNVAVDREKVILYYRTTGSPIWKGAVMVPGANNYYSTPIPVGDVKGPGMEYYITASDTTGNTVSDPSNAPTSSYPITISTTTIFVELFSCWKDPSTDAAGVKGRFLMFRKFAELPVWSELTAVPVWDAESECWKFTKTVDAPRSIGEYLWKFGASHQFEGKTISSVMPSFGKIIVSPVEAQISRFPGNALYDYAETVETREKGFALSDAYISTGEKIYADIEQLISGGTAAEDFKVPFFKGIAFTVNKDIPVASLDVESFVEQRADGIAPPTKLEELGYNNAGESPDRFGNKRLSYFWIDTGGITDADLDEAKIRFSVPRSWLDVDRIFEDNVTLLRLVGNVWESLPTAKIGDLDTDVVYEAETSGFSYFAITGSSDPYECSGDVGLALSAGTGGSLITGTISGLTGCEFVQDPSTGEGVEMSVKITEGQCADGTEVASGPFKSDSPTYTFSAPTVVGNHDYYACLDKDLDGVYDSAGEESDPFRVVIETSTTTTGGGTATTTSGGTSSSSGGTTTSRYEPTCPTSTKLKTTSWGDCVNGLKARKNAECDTTTLKWSTITETTACFKVEDVTDPKDVQQGGLQTTTTAAPGAETDTTIPPGPAGGIDFVLIGAVVAIIGVVGGLAYWKKDEIVDFIDSTLEKTGKGKTSKET